MIFWKTFFMLILIGGLPAICGISYQQTAHVVWQIVGIFSVLGGISYVIKMFSDGEV